MDESSLIIYTDGGSRGNPGEAAYGFVVYTSSKEKIYEEGKRLGIATNNVAEYMGVLCSLQWLEKQNDYQNATIHYYMDSMLIASQLAGKWRIKDKMLQGLVIDIKTLQKKLNVTVTYTQVPRAQNKEADRMVNKALDNEI